VEGKKKRDKRRFFRFVPSSDLDWIQTSNLLSRNQVRYSVAPRGRLMFRFRFVVFYHPDCGCKYINKCLSCKPKLIIKTKKMTLNQYVREIQDFPKPGIVFKDITP